MSLAGLGRRACKDPDDQKYLLARQRRPVGVTHRYWWTPPVWDQGATSHCVAYSGVRYLMSGPVMNRAIPFEELYNQCQELDEWDGNDYDGTSVRALFKAFKARGIVGEYRWAFECAPVVDHLLRTGPVVLGTVWTEEMANPSPQVPGSLYLEFGELDPDEGGHAWCATGVNLKRRNPDGTVGAVRGVNSWGTGWGDQGRFWVTLDQLERLIKADGEACVATEIRNVQDPQVFNT